MADISHLRHLLIPVTRYLYFSSLRSSKCCLRFAEFLICAQSTQNPICRLIQSSKTNFPDTQRETHTVINSFLSSRDNTSWSVRCSTSPSQAYLATQLRHSPTSQLNGCWIPFCLSAVRMVSVGLTRISCPVFNIFTSKALSEPYRQFLVSHGHERCRPDTARNKCVMHGTLIEAVCLVGIITKRILT